MYKYASVIVFVMFLFSCRGLRSGSAITDNCVDLPKLKWQNESVYQNDSLFFHLIADIKQSANFDSLRISRLGESFTVGYESALAKTLRKVSISNVSQEFWEADIVFRQLICYAEAKAKDQGLKPSTREQFELQILELLKSRKFYLENIQKKN